MSDTPKSSSATKVIGKICTILALLLLIAVAAASWYIGGQLKAVKKYASSIASDNLRDNRSVISEELLTDSYDDNFAKLRDSLKALPQFADMSGTDVIGTNAKITERRMISPDLWECSAEITYFCGGKYSEYDCSFTLRSNGIKWVITVLPEMSFGE